MGGTQRETLLLVLGGGGYRQTILDTAEEVIGENQYAVPADEVLKLAVSSGCTGYDSEFALLARDLSVRLVTLDRELLRAFPEIAVSLDGSIERP